MVETIDAALDLIQGRSIFGFDEVADLLLDLRSQAEISDDLVEVLVNR